MSLSPATISKSNIFYIIFSRHFVLASSTTPVRIIVKGIDDAGQKAALLNSQTDELNNESVSIQFKHAREGCIVLHVTILNKVLQDQSTLVYELTNFLGRVFRVGNLLELNPIAEGNIILTADEHDEGIW